MNSFTSKCQYLHVYTRIEKLTPANIHSPEGCLESTLLELGQTLNSLLHGLMRYPVFSLTVLAAVFHKTAAGATRQSAFSSNDSSHNSWGVKIICGISKHETIQGWPSFET